VALDATAVLTLQALEEAMWRPETRFDRHYMDAILAPGFVEIGQSGRVYSRDDALGVPAQEIDVELPLTGLTATEVAPGTALVRYTSVPARRTAEARPCGPPCGRTMAAGSCCSTRRRRRASRPCCPAGSPPRMG